MMELTRWTPTGEKKGTPAAVVSDEQEQEGRVINKQLRE